MVLQGTVLAVCTSEQVGTRKTNVGRARLIPEHGLEGDAHAGSWHRQVSLLARESADKIRAQGLEIGPGDFAENILTEGLDLRSLPVGTRLRIGSEVVLEVTQIGKECHTGCAIRQLTGDCVMPREGIFARVLRGGWVQVGDVVEVVEGQVREARLRRKEGVKFPGLPAFVAFLSAFVSRMAKALPLGLLLLALLLTGCGGTARPELVLATTTSTYDTGLLDAILPDFEARYNVRVRVIAVGTGQAFELGRRGDADVLLVHDPAGEEAFVSAGYGLARYEVMYNDFVIVGPADDPAGIAGMGSAAGALARIMEHQALFCSRGDDSGTHRREKALWEAAGVEPAGPWYLSLGQGMGATLLLANEKRAYTLSDRGTFLSMRDRLPNLRLLVGGATIAENPDPSLRNFYSLIPLNPARYPHLQAELAQALVEWMTSPEIQEAIARFGREKYGQPLFYPAAGK